MDLSPWTKEDLIQVKALDELISKKASWNLSTADAIQLYKVLVWVAQLPKKIEDSQAEILAVRKPSKQEKEKLAKGDNK